MKITSISTINYSKTNLLKKSFKANEELKFQDELIAKEITPDDVSLTNTRLVRNDNSPVTVDFKEGDFKQSARVVLGLGRKSK